MNYSKKHKKQIFNLIPFFGFFIIIFTILFIFSNDQYRFKWESISKPIKDSISEYEFNSISSGIGGNGADFSFEVKKREWIMLSSSISELEKLKTHPSGTIKAIAYEGLLRKENYRKKYELVIESFKDSSIVYYQSGCLSTGIPLNEYLVNYVLGLSISKLPQANKVNFGFTDIEEKSIISEYYKLTNEK